MHSLNLDGKTVFVSGGTGTIGRRVVMELLTECAKVIVYSRDQNKQFEMDHDFGSKRIVYRNGDICDYELLERSMRGADYVIHCAASKHVPLCEMNADSAIKINVGGTKNMLTAASRNSVKRFMHLSTDKAVDPTSVMGASKFLAERLVLEYNAVLPCSIVRLGNVFGSNGSVVPTFRKRVEQNLPLIVNSPTASRYFIGQQEVGEFIVQRLMDMQGGEIFIKKMKLMTVTQLAECMRPTDDYPIKYGRMTPGEKIKEKLITQDEVKWAWDFSDFIMVKNGSEPISRPTDNVEFYTNDQIIEMLKKDA